MAGCRRYDGPRRGGQLGGKAGRLCSVDQLQASCPADLLVESSQDGWKHTLCAAIAIVVGARCIEFTSTGLELKPDSESSRAAEIPSWKKRRERISREG